MNRQPWIRHLLCFDLPDCIMMLYTDPDSGTSGCILTGSPAGDLSLSSMVLHPLDAQSCCALIRWAPHESWQTGGSPSRVKKLFIYSFKKNNNQMLILAKQFASVEKKKPAILPRRAIPKLERSWMRSVFALRSSCLLMIPRPVCGDARQFVTYFGGGSNHSII